ncbi:MAG: hypothetical protein VSS75_009210 [Candidatus Parabeggiatoa sp.]|nr:hypothetical protein [Candidatus Parabeggiatoa sp.]
MTQKTLAQSGIEKLKRLQGIINWGCGSNGSGKNRLGIILMETWEQLVMNNDQ